MCGSASSSPPSIPTLTALYVLPRSVCFSSLKSDNQKLLRTIDNVEPITFQQAALHPAWQEAMLKEFKALEANNTWEIVPLRADMKPIENG